PPTDAGVQGETGTPGVPAPAPVQTLNLPPGLFKSTMMIQTFEMVNLGLRAEVELTLDDTRTYADMGLTLTRKVLAETISMDPDKINNQPVFEIQELNTQILARTGLPSFAGTLSPPAGAGTPGGKDVQRVWMVFLSF